MADKKKSQLADALLKATVERNADRREFIEQDKSLTVRREGKDDLAFLRPPNADIGVWQRMQQEIGKQRGFLQENRRGKLRYEEQPKKGYPDRPAEKLATGKIKRKRYPSVTI